MIRLTGYHNGSPIYVPADVVIKENYKYEYGSKNALPVTEYKPIDGAMVVYDGIEYAVKEPPEEVARKVLEWKYIMQKGAFTNTQEMARLRELAGLEEPGRELLALEGGEGE
mgnify:CR=1 FL=1